MTAIHRFLCLIPLLGAAACSEPTTPVWHGYIEGEFLYLAAPQAGYLAELPLKRGSRVDAGGEVFVIDAEPDSAELAAAQARTEAARGTAADLKQPRRDSEIAALEAQVRAAASTLALANTRLRQQQALAEQNFVAEAALDSAIAARKEAAAALDAAREQLRTYRDSLGRREQIASAEAQTRAADAEARRQAWVVRHKTVSAPASGEVSDTFFQPGEWVGAGTPVAALLPDDKRRVRFFVPQAVLPTLAPGDTIRVRCDGCGAPFEATIDFIASEAEYTPPVIYSEKMRAQLVFRVEAVPPAQVAGRLRPGQPVDVLPEHSDG